MTSNDIPSGLSLCRSAGWNQTAADWSFFLRVSPGGCLVATDENENIIGTVTTVRYQKHFSWIGMVLVQPDRQGQGIGTQLLMRSLHILHGDETVKLDATPAGREVYLKLGFADEYPLRRLQRNGTSPGSWGPNSGRPVQHDDWARVLEMDRRVFGADRDELLTDLFSRAPQLSRVIFEKNKLTGYCFGRIGHNFTHIGPVIAETSGVAIQLISNVLQANEAVPFIVDVRDMEDELLTWLTTRGFVEQRGLTRMYRGSNKYAGIPEKQLAILGPEFG